MLLVAAGLHYNGRVLTSTKLNGFFNKVYLGAGPYYDHLYSTEVYTVGVSSQWIYVSPIPGWGSHTAATTFNNRIYLTGLESLNNIEV